MSNQLDLVLQILAVTGPVFIMVIVGLLLRRTNIIDEPFINTASNLTFRLTMPLLLFIGIIKTDLNTALKPDLIVFFSVATLASFALAWLWALKRIPLQDRGVYVQGAFRGNCGIVGLALAVNQYGDYGLAIGSILSGLAIILFNILSTIVLSVYSPLISVSVKSIAKGILRNPLIISVFLALLASYVQLYIPEWMMTSAEYIASMTLPIALICIGGSLSIESLLKSGKTALSASLLKLILLPLLFTGIGWMLGFSGRELGILFLFLASPTAAISYVMAKAAGGDARLAANIIALSTVLSILTVTAGLYTLEHLGWV
ncbi:AEC family transporter [Nitrincola sp.]|uniref:AEC family transporter n=1 Tax=Nitrincola sp. TaxID=1926584 RepID=UPI003A8CDDDC